MLDSDGRCILNDWDYASYMVPVLRRAVRTSSFLHVYSLI